VEPAVAEQARAEWAERLGPDVPVVITSSVTRAGLGELTAELLRRVGDQESDPAHPDPAHPADGAPPDLAQHRVFRPAARRAYQVRRTGEGTFSVTGDGVERLLARYDLDNEEALAHLERRLRGIGVITALQAEGFQPGDEVEIAGVAFDLDPE
jgi:GTP-binding protein